MAQPPLSVAIDQLEQEARHQPPPAPKGSAARDSLLLALLAPEVVDHLPIRFDVRSEDESPEPVGGGLEASRDAWAHPTASSGANSTSSSSSLTRPVPARTT
jgi:hypothetical protein